MAGHDVINWLDGNANVGVEKICPGRHVRENEWQPGWNDMYLRRYDVGQCYDYISDYECIFNHPIDDQYLQYSQKLRQKLQAAKNQGWPLKIKALAHFTNRAAAREIVNDHGFRGGLKKVNKDENHDVSAKLSWWSPVFTHSQRNSLRKHLGKVIQFFIDEKNDDLDDLKDQFATSDAFKPNAWRYGSHFFQYDLKALCKNYSQSVIHSEPQYKILGTFGYKKEVMHAVLVCSKEDGAGQFSNYPDVPVNNKAVVVTRDDDGNWYWRPQATGGGKILRLADHHESYPLYRRWEHVAFAFHIPDDKKMECDSIAFSLLQDGDEDCEDEDGDEDCEDEDGDEDCEDEDSDEDCED